MIAYIALAITTWLALGLITTLGWMGFVLVCERSGR